MADGDNAAQGDLLADKSGGAAAGTDGAAKAGDAKADAGKAAAPAGKDGAGDDGKAAADKVTADAEAARVAALTPEQKAAEVKAAGDKAKDGDAVDYGKAIAEVKLPDGMTLNADAAKAAGDLFGKHKISADAAKELTALYAQQVKAGGDAATKAFADQVQAWKTESTADKDLGAENLGLAKTTAGKVFDAKTIELMEHFGLMNHPGVLKGLVKIGKATKDDSFVPGDAGATGSGNDARKQFPNSNMNA